jgi:hypothetical protein
MVPFTGFCTDSQAATDDFLIPAAKVAASTDWALERVSQNALKI